MNSADRRNEAALPRRRSRGGQAIQNRQALPGSRFGRGDREQCVDAFGLAFAKYTLRQRAESRAAASSLLIPVRLRQQLFQELQFPPIQAANDAVPNVNVRACVAKE